MIMLVGVVTIVAAMVCGIVADSTLNYPLGKYVTTTEEYNQTFGDSFSGYIVSKNQTYSQQKSPYGMTRVRKERCTSGG